MPSEIVSSTPGVHRDAWQTRISTHEAKACIFIACHQRSFGFLLSTMAGP
jgi:hypothetical protein